MEKCIKLDYDYSTPESFFGDVDYVIKQKEGEDVSYDITEIIELEEDEEQEEGILVFYIIK